MKVFAYIQYPMDSLPHVIYIPISNLNEKGMWDVINFKSLTLSKSLNLNREISIDNDISSHILKMKFKEINKGVFIDDGSISDEIHRRIQIWNQHSKGGVRSSHQFNNDFNDDPLFKNAVTYYPIMLEHNCRPEDLIYKFVHATHVYDINIVIVDYVIVQDVIE